MRVPAARKEGPSLASQCEPQPLSPVAGYVPTPDDIDGAKKRTDGIYCEALDLLAHDVIRSSVECMKGDRVARNRVFKLLLCAYCAIFVTGLAAFVAALVKGLMADSQVEAITTGAFAGLSAAAFVSLLLFKPLDSLKRNSIFLTWLNLATTSFWTRHYYLNKRGTLDHEMEAATLDALAHLRALLHECQLDTGDEPGAAHDVAGLEHGSADVALDPSPSAGPARPSASAGA